MEPHPHFTGEEVGPGKARGPYQVMEANDKRRAGAPHPAPYGESFPPPQPASPLASLLHQAFCIMGTTQGAKEPRTSEDIREQTGRPVRTGHWPFCVIGSLLQKGLASPRQPSNPGEGVRIRDTTLEGSSTRTGCYLCLRPSGISC